jgi:hypothetical protein
VRVMDWYAVPELHWHDKWCRFDGEIGNGFRRPHPSNRERGSPAHAGGRERGRFLPTNELLESKVPLVPGIPVLYRLFDPTDGKVKLFHSAPLFF